MTDQTIPADKVREILDEWERIKEYADWEDMDNLVQDVRALLPDPPRPTLADMTSRERAACQWRQCEVRGERRIIVLILDDSDENYVVTLDSSGYISHCPLEWVTPLPDLPRMSWPGTEKVEDANTMKAGDVIESATDPRLDALPAGTVLVDCDGETVVKRSEEWAGIGYIPIESEGDEFGPWTVRRIGWENG